MARKTKLTPETQATIVRFIRAGSYDWVAAAAAGVGSATFRRWMADDRAPYRAFRAEIERARAEVRAAVEISVRRDNPLAWLRYGPGRERPGEPGWTEPKIVGAEVTINAAFTIDARRQIVELPNDVAEYLDETAEKRDRRSASRSLQSRPAAIS